MVGEFAEYETVERCILCRSARHRPLPGRAHIRRCGSCGHLFLTPRPTQDAIVASYETGEGTHDVWEREREGREAMWRKRAGRVAAMSNEGRALDVGTGFGDFIRHLRDTGHWEVEGTEISRKAAIHAEETHGLTVHQGQVEDSGLAEASYDLVTLWHVLEHVPDPGATLDFVTQLLKPGGTLAVAVPNEGLWPRLTLLAAKDLAKWPIVRALRRPYRRGVDAFFGEPAPGREIHLSYFHPKNLARAMESRGLTVVERAVDDLYPIPTPRTARAQRAYAAVNRATGTNFGPATFLAAKK
jgi:SAM-dependent methyltransferase